MTNHQYGAISRRRYRHRCQCSAEEKVIDSAVNLPNTYPCRPRVNGLARVDERGACFVVVPIKYSVGVRHALIAPQSYDVRVHVYTYSKVVTRRDL